MRIILALIILWTLAFALRLWGDQTVWADITSSAGMIALSITVIIITWRYLK